MTARKRQLFLFLSPVLFAILLAGCQQPPGAPKQESKTAPLVGAWKSRIQFQTGGFASIKDLEFMYVFNAGGTMTESSNYDAAPPVPPAYGIWKEVGHNEYEVKYQFYITRPPAEAESASGSMGWLPAGYGELTEKITLSVDGDSFTSKLHYEAFDQQGKPATGGGDATGKGVRIR